MDKSLKLICLSVIINAVLISGAFFLKDIIFDKNVGIKTSTSEETNNTSTSKKEQSIKFQVNKFDVSYDESTGSGVLWDEKYTGKGYVTASGPEDIVKKPYYVVLNIKRVKGGNMKQDTDYTILINILNGAGTFETSDSNWKKENKMSRPEYEFTIIGYIPIIKQ